MMKDSNCICLGLAGKGHYAMAQAQVEGGRVQ